MPWAFRPGIAVAASLIDRLRRRAFGTLAADGGDGMGRLAVIAGTSVCHIALTKEAGAGCRACGDRTSTCSPKVLGRLRGGQSAAGFASRYDPQQACRKHQPCPSPRNDAGRSLHQHLAALLGELSDDPSTLTRDRHIQARFFHGQTAPRLPSHGALAPSPASSLDVGARDLPSRLPSPRCRPSATERGNIIETMEASGAAVGELVMSGGLATRPAVPEGAGGCDGARCAGAGDVTNRFCLAPPCWGLPPPPMAMPLPLWEAHGTRRDQNRATGGAAHADYHARKYAVFRHMQDSHA